MHVAQFEVIIPDILCVIAIEPDLILNLAWLNITWGVAVFELVLEIMFCYRRLLWKIKVLNISQAAVFYFDGSINVLVISLF